MLCDGQEGDEVGYVGGDDDDTEEPPTADHNSYGKPVWFVRTACKTIHTFDKYARPVNGHRHLEQMSAHYYVDKLWCM